MPLRTLHRAFVLAAVLLVGGVALPVAHRVEHAHHAAKARTALHAADGHVHAAEGRDALSVALPAFVSHDVVCVLCAGWTAPSLAPAGSLVPARLLVGVLAGPAGRRPLTGALARSIRGPPALF